MDITHDDLKHCAALAREAQNIRERMERIRSLAEFGRMGGSVIGGNGAPVDDRSGEGATALADIEAGSVAKIEAYLGHVACVEQAIARIPDPTVREVLRLYYVDGYIWDQVAEHAHYDARQCQRIRDRGLRVLGITA